MEMWQRTVKMKVRDEVKLCFNLRIKLSLYYVMEVEENKSKQNL